MAHGTPDWWGSAPRDTTYALQDMAELAARLGSIVTWDRRGDVIFTHSFETGISPMVVGVFGTGCDYWLTSEGVTHGGLSLWLKAGSDAQRLAQASVFLPPPVLGKCGVEVWFGVHARNQYIMLNFAYYTGAAKLLTAVRYDHVNSTVEYWDSAGAWQQLAAGVSLYEFSYPVHVFKLVVDFLNADYVRVILDQHTYPMTASIQSVVDTTKPRISPYFSSYSTEGYNAEVPLDSVIVTQNEP